MTALAVTLPIPVPLCPAIIGCSAATSIAESAAKDAATSMFSIVESWLASGASWLVDHVLAIVTAVPTAAAAGDPGPLLASRWFDQQEQAMLLVTGLVVLPLLFAATIGAVLRQDFHRLGRTWGVALPVALLGGAAAVKLTQLALAATDDLTKSFTSAAALASGYHGLAAANTAASPVPFVGMLASGLIITGAVLLWLELVVRAAAVSIAVLFLPLALAGLVWPATAHMAKRLVELLAALVLSKFVIAATLSLGMGALAASSGMDQVIVGGAILLLAAFAPFSVLRLVPIVEGAMVAHLEGLSRRPAAATRQAVRGAAVLPNHPVAAYLRAGSASESSRLESVPVGAQSVPDEPGWFPTVSVADAVASSPPGAGPSRGDPPFPESEPVSGSDQPVRGGGRGRSRPDGTAGVDHDGSARRD